MESDSAQRSSRPLELKDIAVVAPLLGSALCVTYDLGYFYGIDINQYTSFSLTEHVVFALQAVPIAFVFLVAAPLMGIVLNWSLKRATALVEQKRLRGRSRAWPSARAGVAISFVVATVFYSAVGWWMGESPSSIAVPSLISLSVIAVVLVWPDRLRSGIAASVGMILSCFALGMWSAHNDLQPPSRPHVIEMAEARIVGRLIRTGERGILFYIPDKQQITLVRWDGVKQVSRVLEAKP